MLTSNEILPIYEHLLLDIRQLHDDLTNQINAVSYPTSSNHKRKPQWHQLMPDSVWRESNGQVKFYPAETQETMRVQDPFHDRALRITKLLTRRGWHGLEDGPFAKQDPEPRGSGWAHLLKPIAPPPSTEWAARGEQPGPDGHN